MAFELKTSPCEQSCSVGTGEIAEVADTDKASRQHVLAKATQELDSGESHDALFIATSIVSPSEAHAVTIEAKQALIADGDTVGIAADIVENLSWPGERWLRIDDPLGLPGRRQVATERRGLMQMTMCGEEVQLASDEGLFQIL